MMAEELNGQHIGRVIGFAWKFPYSNVEATVTGELREVHHCATDDVVVWLAGDDSNGSKSEFTLQRGATVAAESGVAT